MYVSRDPLHLAAKRELSKFKTSIPYTLLSELELLNALSRCLGNRLIDQAAHDAILRAIQADEADGILERIALNQVRVYEKARELSRKYTPTLACRSLDILHVASALVLDLTTFASLDHRQRQLAEIVGLQVLPLRLP